MPGSIPEEPAMNWKHKSLPSTWTLCIVVLALLRATSLYAAFEGFGSSTPGGNNGSQVTVTSLADSGPGTLREAIANANNRRIVFAVGGTINLKSSLEIRGRSFVTIDGSTAPSPGITLHGSGFYIRNSHDIVLTHLRIRNSVSDGITLWDGSYNVVIDHCSVTNSADGNIDITEDTRDVTVSWSIIGDTRPDWFSLKTKGMLIANFNKPPVSNISLHHNLFINEFQRSPQVSTAGLFDIRNNVIWDWGSYGIRLRQGAWGNIINNIFDTNNNPEDAVVLEFDAGPVYIHGNQGPGASNVNSLTTAAGAFNVAPVTTDAVTDVEQIVLQWVGALPRDAVDTSLAGSADSVPPPTTPPPVATNHAPTVNAGANQTITLPASASLNGTVTDDGLPAPGTLTSAWTRVSGPGSVSFANASAIDTTASFTTAGTYVLRLTTNDGALSAGDDVTVTVNTLPSSGQAVISLTLINASTDEPIATLNNGGTLNLATFPTRNLNIRADTSPAAIGSVRFGLDGKSNYRTDSRAPYALAGDNNGNYYSWRPSLGSHTVTATPYSEANAKGTIGTPLTITFTVINQPN
jgi:pectate lyase